MGPPPQHGDQFGPFYEVLLVHGDTLVYSSPFFTIMSTTLAPELVVPPLLIIPLTLASRAMEVIQSPYICSSHKMEVLCSWRCHPRGD